MYNWMCCANATKLSYNRGLSYLIDMVRSPFTDNATTGVG